MAAGEADFFRLDLVAGNANLTFIAFMAFSLIAVLGLRFAFYAYRNREASEIDSQRPIWNLLTYAGALGMGYGLAGMADIVSPRIQTPWSGAVVLAATLMLAFTIRQIHFTASDEGATAFELVARAFFLALVFAVLLAEVLAGPTPVVAAAEGVAALLFVGYGGTFYVEQTSNSRLQGTMIDSLLRHVLPMLTFAALVSIVNVAQPFGLPRVVVLHVQVVFVIMTATALMTGTIKLRQNLASL